MSRTAAAPAMARADFIEGMAKGMAVLESFDTTRQRLNATQAAERAGITRAAARRHLLTLAALTPNRSPASRCDAPAAPAAKTRTRRSIDSAFDMTAGLQSARQFESLHR